MRQKTTKLMSTMPDLHRNVVFAPSLKGYSEESNACRAVGRLAQRHAYYVAKTTAHAQERLRPKLSNRPWPIDPAELRALHEGHEGHHHRDLTLSEGTSLAVAPGARPATLPVTALLSTSFHPGPAYRLFFFAKIASQLSL